MITKNRTYIPGNDYYDVEIYMNG